MTLAELQVKQPLPGLEGLSPGARVVVAMSGGVDSSAVAALLQAEGYETIGITLQLYDHGAAISKKGACCAGQDIRDARRVAEAIGIPHYVLDYENRFRESVMQDFADSYARGETPIPCVRCNQTVKFTDLMNMARELGAEALATGHYVRRKEGPAGPELYRGADEAKDQSYFLFATTQEQLALLRFPLGDMTKAQTRALAERFKLRNADKPDSQDICFVPEGRYADIVARLRPDAVVAGDIVDLEGNVLGGHEGIINFTVGQRRGLGLATGEPLFVVRLNAAQHQVVVGPREVLGVKRISVGELNWLAAEPVPVEAKAISVLVKVRSTRAPVIGRVWAGVAPGLAEVELSNGEEAVAPGQACVFYSVENDGQVLGGGFIRRSE